MSPSAAPKYLSAGQSAQLFTLLKRLETAGLPAVRAAALLRQTEPGLQPALAVFQQQLSAGKAVAQAGYNAGLFNATQLALVAAGETSGRLGELYALLADYYTALDSRIRKVKRRLYLPALLLMLALLVQPLPALVSAQITIGQYLQLSFGRFAVIAGGFYALLKLPVLLQRCGLSGAWHALLLQLPGVSGWIVTRQCQEFLFMLALLLEAGLSFDGALPQAVAVIKNSVLRERFRPALLMLGNGSSVAATLAKVPVLTPTALQVINSGEQSGKLPGSIRHYARLEAERISLQDEALVEWLPRLVYALIAAWMAYSILGSPIATVVPNDLS